MTLRELVDRLGTVEVELAGERFKARIVSGLEADLIARIYPRPDPPMVADGSKGSLAPKVPNLTDPAFVAADEAWFVNHTVSIVAASLDGRAVGTEAQWPEVTLANHGTLEVRQQAERYLNEARPLVARLGLGSIREAYRAVTTPPAVGDALKN